jgi:hypothetical protein
MTDPITQDASENTPPVATVEAPGSVPLRGVKPEARMP